MGFVFAPPIVMGSPYIHFMEQVNSISEADYGDYMRKLNAYLVELKENKTAVMTPEILNKIEEMQRYIQFMPNWDISSTQEKVLEDADRLIQMESLGSL